MCRKFQNKFKLFTYADHTDTRSYSSSKHNYLIDKITRSFLGDISDINLRACMKIAYMISLFEHHFHCRNYTSRYKKFNHVVFKKCANRYNLYVIQLETKLLFIGKIKSNDKLTIKF